MSTAPCAGSRAAGCPPGSRGPTTPTATPGSPRTGPPSSRRCATTWPRRLPHGVPPAAARRPHCRTGPPRAVAATTAPGPLDTSTSPSAGRRRARLRRPGVELEPRRMWPSGLAALGVPLPGASPGGRPEPGRAVARLSDIGWGPRLRALLAGRRPGPRRRARRRGRGARRWGWERRPTASSGCRRAPPAARRAWPPGSPRWAGCRCSAPSSATRPLADAPRTTAPSACSRSPAAWPSRTACPRRGPGPARRRRRRHPVDPHRGGPPALPSRGRPGAPARAGHARRCARWRGRPRGLDRPHRRRHGRQLGDRAAPPGAWPAPAPPSPLASTPPGRPEPVPGRRRPSGPVRPRQRRRLPRPTAWTRWSATRASWAGSTFPTPQGHRAADGHQPPRPRPADRPALAALEAAAGRVVLLQHRRPRRAADGPSTRGPSPQPYVPQVVYASTKQANLGPRPRAGAPGPRRGDRGHRRPPAPGARTTWAVRPPAGRQRPPAARPGSARRRRRWLFQSARAGARPTLRALPS